MMKGQKGYVLVQTQGSFTGRAFRSAKAHVARWYELHRQRHQLAQLSDAALKDLGLSRADVFHETEQHFWNDTMNR